MTFSPWMVWYSRNFGITLKLNKISSSVNDYFTNYCHQFDHSCFKSVTIVVSYCLKLSLSLSELVLNFAKKKKQTKQNRVELNMNFLPLIFQMSIKMIRRKWDGSGICLVVVGSKNVPEGLTSFSTLTI